MENHIYIIEINQECCICLDFLNKDFSKLDCCGNIIHTRCIYDMFVHEPINVNENKVIFTCPLCRKKNDFKNVISLKDIKKYTNDYNILCKYKLLKFNKFNEICRLYLRKFLMIIFLIIIFFAFFEFS